MCTQNRSLENFDFVHWDFIQEALHDLGFPAPFVTRIMECITTPPFCRTLNGSIYGHFKGERPEIRRSTIVLSFWVMHRHPFKNVIASSRRVRSNIIPSVHDNK